VQSKLFKNSVVMTTLGQSPARRTEEARWDAEKRAFFNILDCLIGEMEARFGTECQKLHQSLAALTPSSSKFLAKDAVLYLAELMKLDSNMQQTSVSVFVG